MLSRSISHYEILNKLGEGGMGVVYLARDSRLGRLVALKLLHPFLIESPQQASRLDQEARSISALNHPNIAVLYDVEEANVSKILVLEYLPGGTLSSAMRNLKTAGQRMPLDQAIDNAVQIAQGLAH